MKKRILLVVLVILICFVSLPSLFVSAVTPLDPDQKASLTVTYQKNGTSFSNLDVSIYRVAEALPSGKFELIEPFSSYPINIHDVMEKEQWNNIANTLNSYIAADNILPTAEAKTNENGVAEFLDLKTGLYLVEEVIAENLDGTYEFNRFMVYLPTLQSDGSYLYNVAANPKCQNFIPKTEYRVTKLWQDAGNQKDRPKEVLVDIYKDGTLIENQTLNAQNNWSYSWRVSEENQSGWSVTERSVAKNYTVTIQQNGANFSIINTHKSTPPKPDVPQTGDTTNLMVYAVPMCISGIVLIILGIYGRRRKGE